MDRLKKSLLISMLFICIHVVNAQDCKLSELSPEGLEHLNKAKAYLDLFSQGTEKLAMAEYEAILQTDSLWCPDVYLQLGKLCEYIANDKDVSYYTKAILYYKKYNSLMPSAEVKGKIIQLETKKEVLERTLGYEAIKKGVKIEMVYVEGMLNEDTTACLHSFYIGKYEVTQEQWQSVMNSNPSHFRGPNLPVEQITSDYQLFLNELNRITGSHYRLPTVTEWYYAARGGKNKEDFTYSGSFAQNKVAWFPGNSGNRTHEVGEKEPNSLGIYDMSGNVSEICLVRKRGNNGGDSFYKAFGGSYSSRDSRYNDSRPILINESSQSNPNSFYDYNLMEEYDRFKNYSDGWSEDGNNQNIGLRLVLDVDADAMPVEEQLWDSWIKPKKEKLQKEEEKEQRKRNRRNNFRNWWYGQDEYELRWGMRLDYNFQTRGEIKADDVFVNVFFRHSMLGFNLRIPIGGYFYVEPQIKAGITSNWKLVLEQEKFLDQLSTCFDNVQIVHLEIPLLIGGIYRIGESDAFAIRGYSGGQFCPVIQTKKVVFDSKNKSYFALLFGFGFDLGSVTADLYYSIPIKTESDLATRGFTASIGFLF